MNFVSLGDIAQIFQMQHRNVQLKTLAARLGHELGSGVKQDTGAAVRGDFTALAGVERSLTTLTAYATATAEAAQHAATQQTALASIQSVTSATGPTLLAASGSGASTAVIAAAANDARQQFGFVIAALNTSTAGRFAFSGARSDAAPLIPVQAMLTALAAAVAGLTSPAAISDAISDWFDAPAGGGGYLDTAYTGGMPQAEIALGAADAVALDVTAADPLVRDMLKGLALASLIAEGTLAGDIAGQSALLLAAGQQVLTADGDLTFLRSGIGAAEARIDEATSRNSAEATMLQIARAGMLAADPYETATALQATETQLETLYTLTARLSRLSLTDYLS
jgi:flagellar hook-associated protein 3 FlgL